MADDRQSCWIMMSDERPSSRQKPGVFITFNQEAYLYITELLPGRYLCLCGEYREHLRRSAPSFFAQELRKSPEIVQGLLCLTTAESKAESKAEVTSSV